MSCRRRRQDRTAERIENLLPTLRPNREQRGRARKTAQQKRAESGGKRSRGNFQPRSETQTGHCPTNESGRHEGQTGNRKIAERRWWEVPDVGLKRGPCGPDTQRRP